MKPKPETGNEHAHPLLAYEDWVKWDDLGKDLTQQNTYLRERSAKLNREKEAMDACEKKIAEIEKEIASLEAKGLENWRKLNAIIPIDEPKIKTPHQL